MLVSLLVFLIVLSVLIFVHELGHFLAAKRMGVKVTEFGFGYPPRLWGKKIGETVYSINLIPFGGFARLYGQEEEVSQEVERAFYSQSKLRRAVIVVAGVLMNVVLGVICFAVVYSRMGVPEPLGAVRIVAVAEGSPAEEAGLQPEDEVVAVKKEEWQPVKTNEEFIAVVEQARGRTLTLKIKRGEVIEEVAVRVRTEEETPEGEGALGVVIKDVELRFYPAPLMWFKGVEAGIGEALAWGRMIVEDVIKMVERLFKGEVPKEVAGPVGVFQATATVRKEGWLAVVQFMGILSINLAVLNMLPIPALDGGWLVFLVLENIWGERQRKIERVVSQIGFALLIFLMLLVTLNDIRRLLGG